MFIYLLLLCALKLPGPASPLEIKGVDESECHPYPTISNSLNSSTPEITFFHSKNKEAALEVICKSLHPIEWDYSGQGIPSMIREFSNRSLDNCTTSTLTFRVKEFDQFEFTKHTGNYTCRHIKSSGTGPDSSSVHLFLAVKGGKKLLNAGKKVSILLEEGVELIIPCVTSDPATNVSLYKSISKGKYGSKLTADYCPKKGFTLGKQDKNSTSLHGTYKCSSTDQREKKDYVIFNVVPPEGSEVKATPNDTQLYVRSLNLTCESEEPVIIREVAAWVNPYYSDYYDVAEGSEGLFAEDIIEETTDLIDSQKYVANHEDLQPIIGSTGTFQCIRERDDKILHSWQYLVIDEETEKQSGLKVNGTEDSISCSTKARGHGKLSFVQCETPSECRINSICLQKARKCRGYDKYPGFKCSLPQKRCRKVHFGEDTGVIRCIGEGVDQTIEFTNELSLSSIGFANKSREESAKLLMLSGSPNEISEGDEVFLALIYRRYVFVDGTRWSFEFINGSIATAVPSYSYNSGPGYTPAVETALFKIEDKSITKIIGSLPPRDSNEWFPVSLPIKVKDANSTTEEGTSESSNSETSDVTATTTDPSPNEENKDKPINLTNLTTTTANSITK